MKKLFSDPTVEIVNFVVNDVVCASADEIIVDDTENT